MKQIEKVNEEAMNDSNIENRKDASNFESARSSKVSGASY